MFRNTRRLATMSAAAIAVIALAVPAVSAAMPVTGGPDTNAAAIEAERQKQGYVDLRSPDAKDAKDAGQPAQAPSLTPTVQAPGFQWGDAAIGAGSVLGLMLIMLSVMFALVHRRSRSVKGLTT